jgi:hypothetical protein
MLLRLSSLSWGPKKSIYILAKHQLMQIQTNQLTNQPSINPFTPREEAKMFAEML